MLATYRLAPGLAIAAEPDSSIHEALDTLFSPLAVQKTAGGPETQVLLQAVAGDDSWQVAMNGTPIATIAGPSALTPFLEGALTGLAVRARPRCTALHAAAVEIEGRVILLVGDKGAGKSTLAGHLALSGARYLGDEVAFVEPGSLSLDPFPKAVTLKQGSFALFPTAEETVHRDPVRGPVRYLRPASASASTTAPIGLLAFPEFDPTGGTEPAVRKLGPQEAVLDLIGASFVGPEAGPRTLPMFAALALTQAARIRYPDLATAQAQIAVLISS